MSVRVCFVVDSGTDVRLADSLAERTSLRVLARRLPSGREISQPNREAFDVELGPGGHLAFALFAMRRLVALRNQIDVVVVQGYGPTAACVNVAGRLIGRPVLMLVCSPVEAYYRCRRRSSSGRRFSHLEYAAIRLFSVLNAWIGQGYVVLSPYLASVIRGHGARQPIDVIPVYGIDREIFRPSTESKASIRVRLGLPADKPIVFFSSRVAPEKDAETVLRAVGLLADRGRPVHLLHLSGGHREFMALAASLGVAQHVIAGDAVVPFAPLADHYCASDVCVQSSVEEGLGFSPLEALACGVPVVATAVGGLNDTIRNGETGWQVPLGDAAALADAIVDILDGAEEAARRTRVGAAAVERSYDRRLVFETFVNRLAGEVKGHHLPG
jgi:glycosyltransferase involved in cell wall biosynthesis